MEFQKHLNLIRDAAHAYGEDNDGDEYLCNKTESFIGFQKDVPTSDHHISNEKKLCWLRSQIIGLDAEFETPFGKRHLTYADHTASGRSLHSVENYIIANLLPYYGNTHTSDSYVGYHTTIMMQEASSYIKKCLGGGDKDAIIFCGSGTTAAIKRLQEVMGLAIPSILRERMLRCLSEEERWVVFVGPYEHHSNILSWRQSLAEVVEIDLDSSTGLVNIDELKQKLEFYKSKNRRMLGCFSACSNVTGIYTDTRAIACLFHQYGGFACFDFAASGPYVKIDMRSGKEDGYDAIFMSPHKFVGGPGSPGILLMNKSLYLLGSSGPSTCGGGTVDFVNGFNEKDTIYIKNIEEREEAGTPPTIQKIRTALTFWTKEYIGYKCIEMRDQTYITRALERLGRNPQIWILGNTSAKRHAIMSFLIYSTTNSSSSSNEDFQRDTVNVRDKPLHGCFVAELLNDLFGIQTRAGCACAGPYGHKLLNIDETHSLAFRSTIQKGYAGIKPGWTRVSFPYYMSDVEFEFILAAIEFVAIYGQRFMPLYHFSWRTGSWSFKRNNNINVMIKALNLERDDNQEISLCKYQHYLATAKRIAVLLPKFPQRRRMPKEIDSELVHFRI